MNGVTGQTLPKWLPTIRPAIQGGPAVDRTMEEASTPLLVSNAALRALTGHANVNKQGRSAFSCQGDHMPTLGALDLKGGRSVSSQANSL